MAYLRLNRLYKVYPNGVKAVNDFSIDIADKEFIVFVGPSGCGKSTTLRMIAGLEEITAGELFLDGQLVNEVEAEDRDIAMVFQNYALYPHMTVYDNMAFGLKNRKVKDHIIKEKISEAVKILDLEDYLQKKPKEMSGGQRQRVALGRAIVRNPKVFLFDEPLSNLDAKLRASMRSEITKLHKKLETTFIYVTHDQVEAMTMGTRIVVMKDGYVQQIDEPMNLYYKPCNKFVAGFIGTPQMNFFHVTLKRDKDQVIITFNEKSSYRLPYEYVCKLDDKYLNGEKPVSLGVRPEHFSLSEEATGLTLTVNFYEKLGNEVIIYGDLEQNSDSFMISEDAKSIIVKADEEAVVETGQVVNLALKVEKIHIFDDENEQSILKDIPDFSSFNATINKEKISLFGQSVKMPPAYLDKLENAKNVTIEISPQSIVKGNDFSLKIAKIEEFSTNKLLHLHVEDKYLFAIVEGEYNVGDDFKFSLAFDQLRVLENQIDLVVPVGIKESIKGKLAREKVKIEGKRKTLYYFDIAGYKKYVDKSIAQKLIDIDGRKSFKKQYKFIFNQQDLVANNEKGFRAQITQRFDYGNKLYANVVVNEEQILVELDRHNTNESQIFIDFNAKNIEVWHPDIDFRII